MHLLSYLTVVVCAGGVLFAAQPGATTMNCSSRREAAALRDAPLGASRATKHRLTVKWSSGVATFRDSGATDGELGGIAYYYCGYAAGPRLHLIGKQDGDLVTGVLLNHVTGKLLPAGTSVAFAPDMSYFAATQTDGVDGEEWYVYSPVGVRQWEGSSVINAKHPTLKDDRLNATLEAPHWSAHGELQATHRCAAGGGRHPTLVTLTLANGSRKWLPMVSCPPMP